MAATSSISAGYATAGSSMPSEIGWAVAVKSQRVARDQGDAVVKLIEQSTQIQQQLMAKDASRGQNLDVLA